MNKVVFSVIMMSILVANGMAFAQTDVNQTQFPTPSILPDNWFYGLKTAIENLQTAFITNDTEKAKFQLNLAEERLAEIKAMLDKGDQKSAAKAQELHDNEVDDAEKIADKQTSDNHGQAVKAYVHQLIANHEQKIGKLVSVFAQNSTNGENEKLSHSSSAEILKKLKGNTQKIRQDHGDREQPNPNVHTENEK